MGMMRPQKPERGAGVPGYMAKVRCGVVTASLMGPKKTVFTYGSWGQRHVDLALSLILSLSLTRVVFRGNGTVVFGP